MSGDDNLPSITPWQLYQASERVATTEARDTLSGYCARPRDHPRAAHDRARAGLRVMSPAEAQQSLTGTTVQRITFHGLVSSDTAPLDGENGYVIIVFDNGAHLYADSPAVYPGEPDTSPGPPAPPEHLADAWRRYQETGDVTESELRALDEWRADAREDALGW